MTRELLKVENLKVHYKTKSARFNKTNNPVKAVDGISFSVYEGESFGIVGESGCGKSTTGKAIIQLVKPTEGSIYLDNTLLSSLQRKDRFDLAKKMQIIFQDSYSSLDPRYSVGKTIEEPLLVHKLGTIKERKSKTLELMNDVGLREEYYDRFPHEFSGGQRQRINIARALSLNPSLIICDEPISALDVSIQAQIMNLMKSLQKQYNLTYIFISHNLSVVKHFCDRVAVMYLGHIVEISSKSLLFSNPLHPYTQILLNSIPLPNPDINSMEELLIGDVPSPINPPKGCVFHTRCKYANEECRTIMPKLKSYETGHESACHRL